MKWFLLIFVPLAVAFSVFVAFAQPITALIWIPSFVAIIAVMTWYYGKHHQGETSDAWEVHKEEWTTNLDHYVEQAKEREDSAGKD